jgi:chromosome segregation ATPase
MLSGRPNLVWLLNLPQLIHTHERLRTLEHEVTTLKAEVETLKETVGKLQAERQGCGTL